jgi:hypothetical protein
MIFNGRDATRRNRNAGKTQGGRVRGGRAREKWSRILTNDLWERLSDLQDPCIVAGSEHALSDLLTMPRPRPGINARAKLKKPPEGDSKIP